MGPAFALPNREPPVVAAPDPNKLPLAGGWEPKSPPPDAGGAPKRLLVAGLAPLPNKLPAGFASVVAPSAGLAV